MIPFRQRWAPLDPVPSWCLHRDELALESA
jgi:hypothetical protein